MVVVVSGVGFTDLGPREERVVNKTSCKVVACLISQIQVFSGSGPPPPEQFHRRHFVL